MKPSVGVGIAVVKDGKILLGKRKGAHGKGSWAFPGGHLEFGESVEACAHRELKEETGLQALSVRLGPWTENIMDNGEKHYVTVFVLVDRFIGEPQLLEPDKCEGWNWFAEGNFPGPIFAAVGSLRQMLEVNSNLKGSFCSRIEQCFI